MAHKSSKQFAATTMALLCFIAGLGLVSGGDSQPPADTLSGGETAASTREDESSSQDDAICLRCFDKVKLAQDLIAVQTSLVAKQKKLISRKHKAAMEAAAGEQAQTSSAAAAAATPSSIRTRMLDESQGPPVLQPEQIVVSRLRVARSSVQGNRQPTASSSGRARGANGGANKPPTGPTGNHPANKKDPDLKRLKQEQQQQLNATCRSLHGVQECLAELSRECIGNLQFHSLEVWSNQFHSKLNCPYRNNPSLRVFPGLRTFSEDEFEANGESHVPVPRRISSDDEVRRRLNAMFPGRPAPVAADATKQLTQLAATTQMGGKSLGVMLKPTLVSQRSNGPNWPQLSDSSKRPFDYVFVGREHANKLNLEARQQRPIISYLARLLVIPSCFAIIVVLILMSNSYFQKYKLERRVKLMATKNNNNNNKSAAQMCDHTETQRAKLDDDKLSTRLDILTLLNPTHTTTCNQPNVQHNSNLRDLQTLFRHY